MSDESQGPGWWQASDGRWYPPQEPPAPGWWLASDGQWYPPADEAAPTSEPAPAAEPQEPSDPGPAPAPAPEPEQVPEPSPPAQEVAAAATTPPVPPTPPTPPTTSATAPGDPGGKASSSKKGLLVGLAVLVVVALVAVIAIVVSGGGGDDTVASDQGDGTERSTTTRSDDAGDDDEGDEDDGEGGDGDGESVISDEMPSEDITLADDVVVVDSERGAMFEAYSDDGTAMLLNKEADGLDELDVGEVLLLSGITVVRVAQIDEIDEGIIITGEPVTLPEVIEDGELEWEDVTLDPEDARLFVYGDEAVGVGEQGSSDEPTEGDIEEDGGEGIVDGLGGASIGPDGEPLEATLASFAAPTGTVSGKVGDFSFDLTHEPEGSGHHLILDLQSSGEMVGTINVDVHVGSLVSSGGAVVAGRQVRSFDWDVAELGGEATITTQLQSTQQLTSIMSPPFLKVPFGVEFPAVVGGIPFTLSVTGTIQVQLSMAMANSTLGGRAEITFGGDAGFHFAGGELTVSGNRVQDAPDLLRTLTGGGGGPVGVVVTSELPKVGFGFGFLQTGAGVYLSNGMVVAQTILPPPPACTSTQIAYVLAAGVEAKFLGKEFDIGRKAVVDKRWDYTVPQTQQCVPELRGG